MTPTSGDILFAYIFFGSILYAFYLLFVFIVYYSNGFKRKLSFFLSLIPGAGIIGLLFLTFREMIKDSVRWRPIENLKTKRDNFMSIYKELK